MRLTLDPQQLRWLGKRLSAARSNGVRHVIVQGHLPVIGSSLPSVASSRLMLEGVRPDADGPPVVRHPPPLALGLASLLGEPDPRGIRSASAWSARQRLGEGVTLTIDRSHGDVPGAGAHT